MGVGGRVGDDGGNFEVEQVLVPDAFADCRFMPEIFSGQGLCQYGEARFGEGAFEAACSDHHRKKSWEGESAKTTLFSLNFFVPTVTSRLSLSNWIWLMAF